MSSTEGRLPDSFIIPVVFGGLCFCIYLIELFLYLLFDVHSATLGAPANCSFRPTPLHFNIVNACASWSDLAVIMGLSFLGLDGCKDSSGDGVVELGNRRGEDDVTRPPPVYSAGAW
ncbi:MAG: hypothetical protein LQ346_004682 [Caloplaca aetnensis]|nr:MAG: hypothetical protein LQ346_004682 [Caloplaca aetnensis]